MRQYEQRGPCANLNHAVLGGAESCASKVHLKQVSAVTFNWEIQDYFPGNESKFHPDGGKFEYLDKEIVAFRRITSNII